MSLFFPDNGKRQTRLIEMAADAQNMLSQSKTQYKEFNQMMNQMNETIAILYRRSELKPPETTTYDIMQASGAVQEYHTADTIVTITKLLVDVAGFLLTVVYVAPGATFLLVETGAMAAETAASVLGTILGVEITIGGLVGGLIAGVVSAAVIVGVGLAVDAIEESIMRDKLRDGIHQMNQIRASLKLSLDKVAILVQSIAAVKRTLDTLHDSGIPLSETIIRNIITESVMPAISQASTLTIATVNQELNELDRSRGSWTNEDVTPTSRSMDPTSAMSWAEWSALS